MNRYMLLELRRALCSPMFVGVMLAVTVSLVLWSRPMLVDGPTVGWLRLLQSVVRDGPLAILAPLVATLPFAQSYAAERNSGFSRLVMQRRSVRSYRRTRAMSTALSGGLVVGLPIVVLMCWLSSQFPVTSSVDYPVYLFGDRMLAESAASAWLLVAIAFCFGAVFAVLGLSASTLFRNPFYAHVVPVAVYIVGTFVVALLALALGASGLTAWEPTAMWDGSIASAVSPTSVSLQYVLLGVGSAFVYIRFFRREEE